MDAFSAQIVKFVRAMPDGALLELVKQKLGAFRAAAARSNGHGKTPFVPALPAPARAPLRAAGVRKSAKASQGVAGKSRRGGQTPPDRAVVSAERQGMLDTVERLVKAGAGLSASDVARSAGVPQTRAAAALKELKHKRRIFQGGDRRFARYAGDARTAEQASQVARTNAKGPAIRASKPSASKPSAGPDARARKRPQTAAPAV